MGVVPCASVSCTCTVLFKVAVHAHGTRHAPRTPRSSFASATFINCGLKIQGDFMLRKLRRVRLVRACAALVVSLFLSLLAYSQVDTGSIRGIVKDTSGAVINGAKVTLTNEDTGFATEEVTSQDGNYVFSPVKIGTYILHVESKGFQKEVQQHIGVDVQQAVEANFSLVPGSIAETVVVTAVAPMLQTQDASVGTVATTAQINDLPLNGRNYTFLAQLGPGATRVIALPRLNPPTT